MTIEHFMCNSFGEFAYFCSTSSEKLLANDVCLSREHSIETAKCFWCFANIWTKNMFDVNIYDREKKLQKRMRNDDLRSLTYFEMS